MTLEEAKDKTAVRLGYKNWGHMAVYRLEPEEVESRMELVFEEYERGIAGDIQIIISDLVKPYSKVIAEYIKYDDFPDKFNEIENKIRKY